MTSLNTPLTIILISFVWELQARAEMIEDFRFLRAQEGRILPRLFASWWLLALYPELSAQEEHWYSSSFLPWLDLGPYTNHLDFPPIPCPFLQGPGHNRLALSGSLGRWLYLMVTRKGSLGSDRSGLEFWPGPCTSYLSSELIKNKNSAVRLPEFES